MIFIFLKRRLCHHRVISGPDHGPRVDVVQLAARPLPPGPARSQMPLGKQAFLRPDMLWGIVPKCPAGRSATAEDVRERNNIHNWIWSGHIQQLGPDFSRAGPPNPSFLGAVVIKGLDQGALTLHDAPSVWIGRPFHHPVSVSITGSSCSRSVTSKDLKLRPIECTGTALSVGRGVNHTVDRPCSRNPRGIRLPRHCRQMHTYIYRKSFNFQHTNTYRYIRKDVQV
jgi:hypothetical protein